ncbi:MAG: efflux transporter periplasmic adaptor subunit [Rheinheimera sp.]|uniref:efflux RND transporter periplasmic adaptor subunit n=1 Tax=Arsukibacterium sp. UBA3155 TaxID=1946058 RepID=UPI000C95FCEE|nr:efflux RND transporter periplasmic adaptor subunit [Arsukibacterium sp. UBA3155]MAD74054.1 efflux transporter periplasmic adaptor subunit [Rheinheimera sp.]|tara:strand:- start:120345 stop:121400 length:1056 start_codon:yes stop_codon:yes gene_type:complete
MKTLSLVVAVLSSAVFLSGCNQANSSSNSDTAEVVAIPVEAALARPGEISSSYHTNTTLEARAETDVISKSSGIVEQVLVEEGDYVKAGQLLALLENERQRFMLAKEQAELSRLDSELKRMAEMYQRQLISTDVYEKLRWQHDATKAAVDLAELSVRETEIRAPIAGVVSRRYVKVGELISQMAPQSLFHLVANSELEAVVHIPEQQLAQAKAGQAAILRFSGMLPVQANISRISPVVDAQSGTVRTTLIIDNKNGELRPGMFAQVELKFDVKTDALLVPKRAIITIDNQHSVYVVDSEDKVSRKAVHLGYSSDKTVEILDGITTGEQVVVAGQGALKDQSLVKVVTTREF